MSYDSDVAIDVNALDVEWVRQAALMLHYARIVAQHQREVDRVQENLDVIKARLDHDVRKNPAAYGLDKITEASVGNTVTMLVEYREAKVKVMDAWYELNIMKASVNALEHKKRALEGLVSLHGKMYFAGPSVPRDLSKEWEQRQLQSSSDADVAVAMRLRQTKHSSRRSDESKA